MSARRRVEALRPVRAVRNDQLLVNSALIFTTTVLMAGARRGVLGDRGPAGHPATTSASPARWSRPATRSRSSPSWASTSRSLRTLPTQQPPGRRRARPRRSSWSTPVAVFALVYALLLPLTSPQLADVLRSPVDDRALLRAGRARPRSTCSPTTSSSASTGSGPTCGSTAILMGVAKCVLPFLLAGAGALGLYGSVGGAILLCAVASLWVILRHVPGPRSLSPSPRAAGRAPVRRRRLRHLRAAPCCRCWSSRCS